MVSTCQRQSSGARRAHYFSFPIQAASSCRRSGHHNGFLFYWNPYSRSSGRAPYSSHKALCMCQRLRISHLRLRCDCRIARTSDTSETPKMIAKTTVTATRYEATSVVKTRRMYSANNSRNTMVRAHWNHRGPLRIVFRNIDHLLELVPFVRSMKSGPLERLTGRHVPYRLRPNVCAYLRLVSGTSVAAARRVTAYDSGASAVTC